MYTDIAF